MTAVMLTRKSNDFVDDIDDNYNNGDVNVYLLTLDNFWFINCN